MVYWYGRRTGLTIFQRRYFVPGPKRRPCRADVQLPIAVIDRIKRNGIQRALMQSTLPRQHDKTGLYQLLPCFVERVFTFPAARPHTLLKAHGEIAIVPQVVLGQQVAQQFDGVSAQGSEESASDDGMGYGDEPPGLALLLRLLEALLAGLTHASAASKNSA